MTAQGLMAVAVAIACTVAIGAGVLWIAFLLNL
jgi:hypothetical protein